MEYPDQGVEALCGKMAKSLYKRPGRITEALDLIIDRYLDFVHHYFGLIIFINIYIYILLRKPADRQGLVVGCERSEFLRGVRGGQTSPKRS